MEIYHISCPCFFSTFQNPTVSGAGGAIEIRRPTIGENFKFLASRLEVYNLFLQNYSKAIETVRRCSINNAKFDELSKNMKMKVSQR